VVDEEAAPAFVVVGSIATLALLVGVVVSVRERCRRHTAKNAGEHVPLEDSEDEQQSEEHASAADDDTSSKEQELERLAAAV
jgi:hypothetical protein